MEKLKVLEENGKKIIQLFGIKYELIFEDKENKKMKESKEKK